MYCQFLIIIIIIIIITIIIIIIIIITKGLEPAEAHDDWGEGGREDFKVHQSANLEGAGDKLLQEIWQTALSEMPTLHILWIF